MPRHLLRFLVATLMLIQSCWALANHHGSLSLGVFAYRPKAVLTERFEPLVRYLEEALEGTRITLHVLDQHEIEEALVNNQLDLLLTNPSHYTILRSQNTLSGALATLISIESGRATEALGGVILVRADRSDLNQLTDLRGRRVAIPGPKFLGGFQTQAFELLQAGVSLKDLEIIPTGGHDQVIQALASGNAEVGFVRTGILEELLAAGHEEARTLRVLNRQDLPGFPYTVSTRLYPEWPFVALPHVPAHQVRRLTSALLLLDPAHPVSRAAGIGGFTTAADYLPVEQLARALRQPPFDAAPTVSLSDLWQQYAYGILACSALLLVLGMQTTRIALDARRLRRERERLKEVLLGANAGSWEWHIPSGRVICNDRWTGMLGYTAAELAPLSFDRWKALLHPDDVCPSIESVQQYLAGKEDAYVCDFRMRHKHGNWIWVRARGQAIERDGNGVPLRMSGIHMDITAQKTAERQLRIAANAFSHAREGIVITNVSGDIIDVNTAFTAITGYERSEVLGKNPRLLQSGRHPKDFYAQMWNQLSHDGCWRGEIWNRRKTGEIYPEILSISAVPESDGTPSNYVAVFSDITPIKRMEQQLQHMAYHDPLTQLPNRMLFSDRLASAIAGHHRSKKRLAVVYIDLDGFKPINDKYGHQAGDELLIALAGRMRKALRECDTLARLGGDEFVALLTNLEHSADAVVVFKRLQQAAQSVVRVGRDASPVSVSGSIGIAYYPEHGREPALLLQNADAAMYAAKSAGKACYSVFSQACDAIFPTSGPDTSEDRGSETPCAEHPNR